MTAALILGSAAMVGSVALLWWALAGSDDAPVNIDPHGAPPPTDMRTARLQLGVSERAIDPLVARMGRAVGRYTPSGRLDAIAQRLLRAGTPAGWTVERVLAAKAGGAIVGAVLGILLLMSSPGFGTVLFLALLAVFGYFLPDILLKNAADKRQEAIRRALSDTVDQIVIVVEAGLGIDAAIGRVSSTSSGPFAEELARVVQDTRVGIPRADALTAMAERVPLPELRHFVVALVQAERLGVPVVQTLRVQSRELRVQRSQNAEEQAGKLPVKILFPTVLCVFPCLFIVLLAPAVIDISRSFSGG